MIVFSRMKMEAKLKLKYIAFLGASLFNSIAFSDVIYGIDNIFNHSNHFKNPVYVQMGNYKNENTAYEMLRHVRSHHHQHTFIKPENGQYKVMVGPFENAHELQNFYQAFHQSIVPNPKQNATPIPQVITPRHEIPMSPSENSPTTNQRWYINGLVGSQFNNISSSTTVNNGSGFPPPYSQDIYSAQSPDASLLLGIGLGRYFELEHPWVKVASIGIQYQYFFANNINGNITQFSLPEFTNYQYTWPLATNIIVANGKLNFKDYKKFSPYFSLGLGGVLHQSDGYTESAYSNVTPRISPNFSSSSNAQFAYLIGVGLDYPIGKQFILSAGYQYSGLGKVQSGKGEGSWSGETLNFGSYASNAFVFSTTYLFDTQFSNFKFLEK